MEYGHSKLWIVSHQFLVNLSDVHDIDNKRHRCLLIVSHTPSRKDFGIPAGCGVFYANCYQYIQSSQFAGSIHLSQIVEPRGGTSVQGPYIQTLITSSHEIDKLRSLSDNRLINHCQS